LIQRACLSLFSKVELNVFLHVQQRQCRCQALVCGMQHVPSHSGCWLPCPVIKPAAGAFVREIRQRYRLAAGAKTNRNLFAALYLLAYYLHNPPSDDGCLIMEIFWNFTYSLPDLPFSLNPKHELGHATAGEAVSVLLKHCGFFQAVCF